MEVIKEVDADINEVLMDMDSVRELFDRQQAHRQMSKNTDYRYRIRKLKHLRKTVKKRRLEIQTALEKDLGKPAFESDVSETFTIIADLNYTISHLKEWMKPKRVVSPLHYIGSTSRVVYEPKGTCLLISPWNIPFYLTLPYAATCFAAGNTAIVKTSELVPNCSVIIKRIIGEVFREEEIAVVSMGAEASAQLTALPFDHIHFTGSTRVGQLIMKAASANLASLTLELGGKSPLILHDDVDIKSVVQRIVWGKLLNLGQICIAVDYILVPESRANELIRELVAYIKTHFGENPIESDMLGRIINDKNFDRLKYLLEGAVDKGAVIHTGGRVFPKDRFIEPTILSSVPHDSPIMQEEIFGPLLPIIPYGDINEALEIIQSKPKPLALYIFGKSRKWISYVMQHTTAGGTSINEVIGHFTNSVLPGGGVNQSGIGKSHGHAGFLDFSNERAVLTTYLKRGITWPFAFPHTRFKKRLADFLLKYW